MPPIGKGGALVKAAEVGRGAGAENLSKIAFLPPYSPLASTSPATAASSFAGVWSCGGAGRPGGRYRPAWVLHGPFLRVGSRRAYMQEAALEADRTVATSIAAAANDLPDSVQQMCVVGRQPGARPRHGDPFHLKVEHLVSQRAGEELSTVGHP